MADENNEWTMIPVTSSQLAEVGYKPELPPEAQNLRIRFVNGSLYGYTGCYQELYDGLMSAPSIGSFFNARIKWNLPYTRLE